MCIGYIRDYVRSKYETETYQPIFDSNNSFLESLEDVILYVYEFLHLYFIPIQLDYSSAQNDTRRTLFYFNLPSLT